MSSYQSRETFRFKECTLLPISTGIQARNLRELREGIEEVAPSCLYYHFWGRLLSPQFPESEYVNDFASWAKVYLHEDALSERLSALDLNHRNDIEDIREELLDLLDETLSREYFISWKEADRTFHFTRAHLIVVETALSADSPRTLPRAIASSSRGSIFFHFIEAKRRNREDRQDDYSKWLGFFGEETAEAREELTNLDPYLHSLTDLRERLVHILEIAFVLGGGESFMTQLLQNYGVLAGEQVISSLYRFATFLQGKKVVHVNSTREGGGVAEILRCMIPLMNELGIETHWEVIVGSEAFYTATKSIHNALQGKDLPFTESYHEVYMETNRLNAERLRPLLEEADFVFIHDPQPAPLLSLCPNRKGKWIWRCHIDASVPNRNIWRMLRRFVSEYDASIFSLADFTQRLPHPQYLIPPSIDPLSEKNIVLSEREIDETCLRFNLDRERPLVVQVSRFDVFKDPIGVIKSYRMARKHADMQIVLAGGGAADDPEGAAILEQVKNAASDDPDIHVIELPSNAHRTINGLQSAADIIMQKSTKEGFGLTVTEGMWKYKPVIGGDVGGIRLQIINRFNGFRVQTPEGAALRLRYLLAWGRQRKRMGQNAHKYVRENFLITTHLRTVLALMINLSQNGGEDLEAQMSQKL